MDPNYAIWDILFQKFLHTSRKKTRVRVPFSKEDFTGNFVASLRTAWF